MAIIAYDIKYWLTEQAIKDAYKLQSMEINS